MIQFSDRYAKLLLVTQVKALIAEEHFRERFLGDAHQWHLPETPISFFDHKHLNMVQFINERQQIL